MKNDQKLKSRGLKRASKALQSLSSSDLAFVGAIFKPEKQGNVAERSLARSTSFFFSGIHMCMIVAAYVCTPLLSLSVLESTSTTAGTSTEHEKTQKLKRSTSPKNVVGRVSVPHVPFHTKYSSQTAVAVSL